MDDQRVGAAFRALRVKRRWRLKDVADRAGVSISLISLIERGHLDRVSLRALRQVAAVLDIRIDVIARWRGGELERLLSSRHSALQDAFAKWLAGRGEWALMPEVSFAIWGERGVIDLLAWHGGTRTLLVIEIKTELVDVGGMLATMDRKVRLAPEIGGGWGWRPRKWLPWLSWPRAQPIDGTWRLTQPCCVRPSRSTEDRCASGCARLKTATEGGGRWAHVLLRFAGPENWHRLGARSAGASPERRRVLSVV